jgi:cation diffusion facilitator CzcD-associated flavoprotein CzcO
VTISEPTPQHASEPTTRKECRDYRAIDRALPVAVVGGGQAGLAVSYHLRQQDLDHVVLDASEHAGDPWRTRWDSLRLFTPARLDHLDAMHFRGPPSQVPTKDGAAVPGAWTAARYALGRRLSTVMAARWLFNTGIALPLALGPIP